MADTGLDSQSRDGAYRRIRPVLGDFARTIDLFGETFSGERMADHDWLAERLADTGSRWGCSDPRINGTLWWYSASSTMVAASVTMLCAEGIAPDPQLQQLECTLHDNGYLGAVRSRRILHDTAVYAEALATSYGSVIDSLAAVSGAAPRALWAVATDSVANRALTAGHALGRVDDACTLAATLAVPPMLSPRFVDIETESRTERFVRRGSCCLIYLTDNDKCASCPRRAPADRHVHLLRRLTDT
ncbi:(2Fe-2S)-binding protein [Rhodococcus sp. C26F]